MTTPWWRDSANLSAEQSAWDSCVLGDVLLPGLARVEVHKGAARKVDDRSAAGSNGWHLREKGPAPVEATITLTLWTADHWAQWERHSLALTRRVRRALNRTAMTIAHPKLAAIGCLSVYVVEVGGLKDERPGVKTVDIKVMQYQPPSGNGSHRVDPPWFAAAPRATSATATDTRLAVPSRAEVEASFTAAAQDPNFFLDTGAGPMARDMSPNR